MFKRTLCVILTVCLTACVAVFASGCNKSNSNYPVTVGNITFDSEPKNVVVLSDCVADIIEYMGYEVKFVGRSDEVSQESLSIVPSVGSKSNPDINAITAAQADVVFCDNTLSTDAKQQLKQANIKTVTMLPAKNMDTLKTMYQSVGKILGGNKDGKNKGVSSYDLLISSFKDLGRAVKDSNTISTIAYLYTENDQIKTFTSGDFGNEILTYTGAVNVTKNFDSNEFDRDMFLVSNPNDIFCDQKTYDTITKSPEYASLKAIKNNKVHILESENFIRQGGTLFDTIYTILFSIHPELYATPDEAAASGKNNTTGSSNSTGGSSSASSNDVYSNSVTEKYNIKITKSTSFKLEQEDDDVMALQKRLDDLGYLTVEPTGYYGELTVVAVKAFQKANDLKETGDPDYKTLTLMFSENAKQSETPLRDKENTNSDTNTQ